jgi:hypothetical protein
MFQDRMSIQAQDMAIEDCLDALSSALDSGSVTVDAFVRNYRLLAEDQYKCRLLRIKVEERQRAKQLQQQAVAGAVQLPQGDMWGRTSNHPMYPAP